MDTAKSIFIIPIIPYASHHHDTFGYSVRVTFSANSRMMEYLFLPGFFAILSTMISKIPILPV